jgi:hypothetical protein
VYCQEKLENERAARVERAKNKVASAQCMAEEQRAHIEAKLGEEIAKAEEIAAKSRAFGGHPSRSFSFFP